MHWWEGQLEQEDVPKKFVHAAGVTGHWTIDMHVFQVRDGCFGDRCNKPRGSWHLNSCAPLLLQLGTYREPPKTLCGYLTKVAKTRSPGRKQRQHLAAAKAGEGEVCWLRPRLIDGHASCHALRCVPCLCINGGDADVDPGQGPAMMLLSPTVQTAALTACPARVEQGHTDAGGGAHGARLIGQTAAAPGWARAAWAFQTGRVLPEWQ